MQKLEKTNERSPRYLKTDGLTDGLTDGQGGLLWTPSGKPGVQNGPWVGNPIKTKGLSGKSDDDAPYCYHAKSQGTFIDKFIRH